MLTNILQPTHLIIVLVIALLILGPKRLPEAGRALGQGLKEFKSSITGSPHADQQHVDDSFQVEQANVPDREAQ